MTYQIGEIIFADDPIIVNEGKETIELVVSNTGDRPIQVCSHYHFFEVNYALKFDREKTFGYHLDVPAGTAVRFEPGEEHKVALIKYSGKQHLFGFKGLTMGDVNDPAVKEAALKKLEAAMKECE